MQHYCLFLPLAPWLLLARLSAQGFFYKGAMGLLQILLLFQTPFQAITLRFLTCSKPLPRPEICVCVCVFHFFLSRHPNGLFFGLLQTPFQAPKSKLGFLALSPTPPKTPPGPQKSGFLTFFKAPSKTRKLFFFCCSRPPFQGPKPDPCKLSQTVCFGYFQALDWAFVHF